MSKVNAIRSIKKAKNDIIISPMKLPQEGKYVIRENGWNNNKLHDNLNHPYINNIQSKKHSALSKPKITTVKISDEKEIDVRRVQSSNVKKKNQVEPEKITFQEEEYKILFQLWNDLGVTEEFRNYFEIYASEFQPKDRKDFFSFEISALKKIHENLSKLTKEIHTREKTLYLTRQFDEFLKNSDINQNIINDVLQTFRNLRVLSINIVNLYIKCRELLSYPLYSGKFDLDKINVNFIFDKGYLLKMKCDTDFLRDTNLKKYFSFSDESDPFLLALSESNHDQENNRNGEEGNHSKIILPINPEILASIKNWYKRLNKANL